MTEEDLAAQLREGLRRRQNDALFLPDREGPLDKPKPWKPDPEPRIECSTGKTVFNTPARARGYLERLRRKIEQGDTSRDYNCLYIAPRCRKCGRWHVTSKKPRQTRDKSQQSPRRHED